MKELEKEFIGTGSVKGFVFKQIKFNGNVYLYEVNTSSSIHYEVFERKESKGGTSVIGGVEVTFEPKVLYPSDNAFGVWAYCCNTIEKANYRFDELNNIVLNRLNN